MANRNSQSEQDAIQWVTAGVRLGTTGLDLRQPSEPGALTRCLNARFLDDRTLEQRPGHTATLIRDAEAFPTIGNTITPERWVYGHGQLVSAANPLAREYMRIPIPG